MGRETIFMYFLVGFLSLLLTFLLPAGLEALGWCLLLVGPFSIARAIFLLYEQDKSSKNSREYHNL